jgi:predicted component of type VI protein secretion system
LELLTCLIRNFWPDMFPQLGDRKNGRQRFLALAALEAGERPGLLEQRLRHWVPPSPEETAGCLAALDDLEKAVTEVMAPTVTEADRPTFVSLRRLLEQGRRPVGGGSAPNQQPREDGGERFPDREEAFATLDRVADFFRRTEPQSPVSYLLAQAIRWGRLPLPHLLAEVVSDATARADLFRRLGLPAEAKDPT